MRSRSRAATAIPRVARMPNAVAQSAHAANVTSNAHAPRAAAAAVRSQKIAPQSALPTATKPSRAISEATASVPRCGASRAM